MNTYSLVDGYFRRYIGGKIVPTEIVNICIRFYFIIVMNVYPKFQEKDIVLIQHQGGKYLTSTKSGLLRANGHKCSLSEWIIKNNPTNNRIKLQQDEKIILLQIHFWGTYESQIMLQSVKYPGPNNFISVRPNNIIQCGNGNDKFCRLKLIHKHEHEWRTPYLFDKTCVVVIQINNNGKDKKYFRCNGEYLFDTTHTGIASQWAMFPYDNGKRVRIRSMKTGKYLRIFHQYYDTTDAGGNGDEYCQFSVHQYGSRNEIKLQSIALKKYLSVMENGYICCLNKNQCFGHDAKRCRFSIFQRN